MWRLRQPFSRSRDSVKPWQRQHICVSEYFNERKKRQLNTGKASAWAVGARSNLCGYDWDWSLSGLELGFSRRRKLFLISLARRPRADFGYSRFLIKLSAETFHCRPKQSAYRVAQHLPIGVYAFFQRLNPHSSEALLMLFFREFGAERNLSERVRRRLTSKVLIWLHHGKNRALACCSFSWTQSRSLSNEPAGWSSTLNKGKSHFDMNRVDRFEPLEV